MAGEELDLQKLRDTLSLIASEVLKYQDYENDSDSNENNSFESENQLKLVLKLKLKLKYKNQMLNKLRKDLSTACTVARTVASAKERQSEAFKNQITKLKEENYILNETLNNQTETVARLSKENEHLNYTLNDIAEFVDQTYKEIENTSDLTENPTIIEKLKKIVQPYDENDARYCNARLTDSQWESKNRFLRKKIYILESNLDSLTEQLKYQQHLNNKQQKQINKDNKPTVYKTVVAYSDLKTKETCKGILSKFIPKEVDHDRKLDTESEIQEKLDLSSHLSIVKKLLDDQDTLSKDLNVISEDICSLQKFEEKKQ